MNVNKVVSFLLLRPAFTGRNVTSLGLVALFFAVYVAAGGKITTVPTMKTGGSFGSVENVVTDKKDAETTAAQSENSAAQPTGQAVSTRIDSLFGSSGNAGSSANTRPAADKAPAAVKPAAGGDKGLDDIEARLKGLGSTRGNRQ